MKELIVSIVNTLIEEYCKRGFSSVDDPAGVYGLGIIDGEIVAADGDEVEDVLEWTLTEILPELLSDKAQAYELKIAIRRSNRFY